jgi:hypothetical protein
MSRKVINKISDKLDTVNDNFTVTMYDNGYLIDISGKTHDDDWRNAKIMVPTEEKLMELIKEAINMPRDGDDE